MFFNDYFVKRKLEKIYNLNKKNAFIETLLSENAYVLEIFTYNTAFRFEIKKKLPQQIPNV